LRVKMKALSQKLQPVGGAGMVPIETGDFHPTITVMRKVGQQWDRIAASVDFDVEPGDVVDVALRGAGAASASN
jgi:polysaccharide biosynthesis/export protein